VIYIIKVRLFIGWLLCWDG